MKVLILSAIGDNYFNFSNEPSLNFNIRHVLPVSPARAHAKNKIASATKTETPILLAARNGITEMVEHILNKSPTAINEKSEGRNIVFVAVENKQPQVLQLLLEQEYVKSKLIYEMDMEQNNALHLAAKFEKLKVCQIPGGALQMQWEVMWYEV